jgi:type I restriction enzyme S subunit
VALLTEQKQAIIHRAVTQGLDPSVPMKASGIPWLGEIPAHWEVRRLSAVARFRNGKAHEQFIDPAGAYVCVNARFVSTDGHKRKLCTRNLTPAHIGDVLMVMSDLPNGRALARAFLVRDDGHYAVNQRVCALTPHKIDPRLLAYSSNRNWHLLRQNDGFNQTHLSNYDFKTMPILLPPPDEQIQIAEWIDHRVRAMDAQLGGLASQIELLREYRARLVADVVTGKLDVRAFAETLPVEAPDDIEAIEADVDEDADDDETGDGADEG